jgi:hypothetical protein
MSGYSRFDAALWQAATSLADRGFRIAMVQLGWDAGKGEKAMLRNPPKDWQNAAPLPSTQVKPAIDAGCNAYLWRLPDGWWVVDADTPELTQEYVSRLGPPDVTTPRGAHWVVDAPAKRLHKLDTGVRGFYGPGSFYPGPDGALRVYTGAVPAQPRVLPVELRRPSHSFGDQPPGTPTDMTPAAAASAVARGREEWLASVKGGRHETLIRYLAVLTRYRLAQGAELNALVDELEAAALEHPDAVAGEEFSSVDSAIDWAVEQARAAPWRIGPPTGLEARFAAPDPGEAPAAADVGDGGELFALGDVVFYDSPTPPPEAVYGAFGGEVPMFYGDGVHWLQGESESGKTWLGLEVVRELLESQADPVIIVDYEDTRASVVERLRALGMTRDQYTRLVYVSGHDVSHAELRAHLEATERSYALMLLDGVTSALTAAGANANDGQEVTRWADQVPRRARMAICIDHVVKAVDDRRGMAIGSTAKKSVVTGTSWEVVCLRKFGRGRDGVIELKIQKDKRGGVRGRLDKGVRLELASTADGTKVRLSVSGGGFFDGPDDALFSALFADGVDGGIGVNELAREAKDRGAGYGARLKADKHRAWLQYYTEQIDDEVVPLVPSLGTTSDQQRFVDGPTQ